MARKPSHLGRTLRNAGKLDESPVVRLVSRELTDEEQARIAASQDAQKARLARIAARARGEEV